mmetsp:Transcript_89358/g.232954  ORF Transcript_89358/g.232954 Transcript_89358/m.232954 type:complete len:336 (-) Transcript_89358:757-1764(-)
MTPQRRGRPPRACAQWGGEWGEWPAQRGADGRHAVGSASPATCRSSRPSSPAAAATGTVNSAVSSEYIPRSSSRPGLLSKSTSCAGVLGAPFWDTYCCTRMDPTGRPPGASTVSRKASAVRAPISGRAASWPRGALRSSRRRRSPGPGAVCGGAVSTITSWEAEGSAARVAAKNEAVDLTRGNAATASHAAAAAAEATPAPPSRSPACSGGSSSMCFGTEIMPPSFFSSSGVSFTSTSRSWASATSCHWPSYVRRMLSRASATSSTTKGVGAGVFPAPVNCPEMDSSSKVLWRFVSGGNWSMTTSLMYRRSLSRFSLRNDVSSYRERHSPSITRL